MCVCVCACVRVRKGSVDNMIKLQAVYMEVFNLLH